MRVSDVNTLNCVAITLMLWSRSCAQTAAVLHNINYHEILGGNYDSRFRRSLCVYMASSA